MTKDTDAWRDPIVEEVRRIRDEIARECGYDIDSICEYLRSQRDKQALWGFKTRVPDSTPALDEPEKLSHKSGTK
ncbi:hypothetical protein MRY87_08550 [bacterium]|nr:hypothetical protein [bacterium]